MRLARRTAIAGFALLGCAAALPARRNLTFRAADGVSVSGLSYGAGERGVVLVPGAHGIGETWDLQARQLARAGLHVLAMDYRGLGQLQGVSQDGDKAHLDVIGAIRQLQADGADQISLVGASWGGRAAAMATIAEPELVDRLVLLAHSTFDHPETLGGRKLFIVARDDRDGSGHRRLDSIREQYERAPEPKKLIVLDGAVHAQFLFLTPQGERLSEEIQRFLMAD